MSELTTDAISKILLEKFPPKMIEVEGGETVIDTNDPQTVYSSIIVSLARRVETSEKQVILLTKQVKEVLLVLKALAPRIASIENLIGVTEASEQAPPQTQSAPPAPQTPVAQTSAVVEETEEEGVPQPNVRATAASSVMPNPSAPNGRS